MPCYSPQIAYRSKLGRDKVTGKWPIVFNRNSGYVDMEVKIPCGQCVGCRLERSRQWAVRCVHEANSWKDNCFITLTYNDECLPDDGSLVKEHYQKFMKRLRKRIGRKVRYYHCGEYGSICSICGKSRIVCDKQQRDGLIKVHPFMKSLGRPHYHAILFGYDFKDRELHSIKNKVKLYRSPTLEKLWKYGYSTVGDVTFESAAYVARYILKKMTGDLSQEYYEGRLPEYTTMSRKPGIGNQWFLKYQGDVYPGDKIIIRQGVTCRPPRYYDNIYDLENPEEFEKIKIKRRLEALKNEDSAERLLNREKFKKTQLKKLIRNYEEML